jgi:hypothetical protein
MLRLPSAFFREHPCGESASVARVRARSRHIQHRWAGIVSRSDGSQQEALCFCAFSHCFVCLFSHRHLLPRHQEHKWRMVCPAHVQSRSLTISLLCPHTPIQQHLIRAVNHNWLNVQGLVSQPTGRCPERCRATAKRVQGLEPRASKARRVLIPEGLDNPIGKATIPPISDISRTPVQAARERPDL